MFRIAPFSPYLRVRLLLSLSALFQVGIAAAADNPPDGQPDASAAIAARNAPPPVPYNSGVSPHEFEIDASKVTTEFLPNGEILIHMNGQGMQAVKASVDAKGRITYTCSDRLEQVIDTSAAVSANAHEQ
jgi:hypothetical protein